jgi:ankyrin repeat protein
MLIHEPTDKEGDTPLHIAIAKQHKWVILNILLPLEGAINNFEYKPRLF